MGIAVKLENEISCRSKQKICLETADSIVKWLEGHRLPCAHQANGLKLRCTLAMGADAVRAIWRWNLRFPSNFFALNVTIITLICIPIKLPMDLSTKILIPLTDEEDTSHAYVKIMSIIFLNKMIINLLPSLALMDDNQLLSNIVAFGILLITIGLNVGI
ncbi:hypothetical protein QVD17_19559 [Tagetes erecta]|uniref:Uncharacterized protein n=1 Tax=Tagetes erecta TaxID=13708 RepID=A0AAD8KMI5_TARER|nr:hypothetical protein QVD17_19559 [Tagetes erecta]